jgi:hypothetical protein
LATTRLINKFTLWVTQTASGLENKWGLLPVSLLAGVVILLSSCLFVWPKVALEYHGIGYAELSKNIFNLDQENELRYRIFSPFIGWLTQMKGNRFQVIPWSFLILFLSAVYYEFRRMKYQPALAFLASALMGFSCTTFLPLRSPGYVDPASYLFIFLMFTRIRNTPLVALLLALALLNHESVVFLLPAILGYHFFIHLQKNSRTSQNLGDTLKFAGSLALAFIPFLLYRHWVNQHQTVHLSLSYYLSKGNILECLNVTLIYAPMAAFYAFRLFWFFPLWAAWNNWQNGLKLKSLWYALTLLLIASQLIIAFDTTRLFILAFPLIIIGLTDLTKSYGEKFITRKGWQLFALNLLILPYFVGRDQVFHLHSGLYRLLIWIIQGMP